MSPPRSRSPSSTCFYFVVIGWTARNAKRFLRSALSSTSKRPTSPRKLARLRGLFSFPISTTIRSDWHLLQLPRLPDQGQVLLQRQENLLGSLDERGTFHCLFPLSTFMHVFLGSQGLAGERCHRGRAWYRVAHWRPQDWSVSRLSLSFPWACDTHTVFSSGPYGKCVYESDNDVNDNQVCFTNPLLLLRLCSASLVLWCFSKW